MRPTPQQIWFVTASVFVFAAILRIVVAIAWPQVSPDGHQYLTVGENVAVNGCISLSSPESAECKPHWGGNHPPGYPLLIAATHLLTDDIAAILVLQALLVALAIAYMARTMSIVSGRAWAGLGVGLLLAFSPLGVAWSRFVLPDAVAVAATIWVAAELLLSLHQGRFRTIPIALALTAAFFARYDGILLVLPVAATGFLLHSPVQALRRGVVCALIFSIPIVLWSSRNVSEGLSFVPDPFLQDGGRSPRGYLAWGNTWIVSIYDGGQMAYALQDRAYDRIRINRARAFDSAAEEDRVDELLGELREKWQGESFPEDIDLAFAALAAERRARAPFRHLVTLPLTRFVEFWANPFYSFAWPLEIDAKLSESDRALMAERGVRGLLEVARKFPLVVAGKLAVLGYRVLLTGLGVVVLYLAFRRRDVLSVFAGLGIGYAIVRTLALSYQPSIDSRYIIEAAAFMEIACVSALAAVLIHRVPQAIPSRSLRDR